jgi:hypothetical protein
MGIGAGGKALFHVRPLKAAIVERLTSPGRQ